MTTKKNEYLTSEGAILYVFKDLKKYNFQPYYFKALHKAKKAFLEETNAEEKAIRLKRLRTILLVARTATMMFKCVDAHMYLYKRQTNSNEHIDVYNWLVNRKNYLIAKTKESARKIEATIDSNWSITSQYVGLYANAAPFIEETINGYSSQMTGYELEMLEEYDLPPSRIYSTYEVEDFYLWPVERETVVETIISTTKRIIEGLFIVALRLVLVGTVLGSLIYFTK